MPVNIHGKNYKMVHERLTEFHAKYENGAIETAVVQMEGDRCVVKATLWPDATQPARKFSGIAFEDKDSSKINKTSFVENCETSAIGRALACAGFGIEEAYASADEVRGAQAQGAAQAVPAPRPGHRAEQFYQDAAADAAAVAAANDAAQGQRRADIVAVKVCRDELIADVMASSNCPREDAVAAIARAFAACLGPVRQFRSVDEINKVRAEMGLEPTGATA